MQNKKRLLASVLKRSITPSPELLSKLEQVGGRPPVLGFYQDIYCRLFLFSDGEALFPIICYDLGMPPIQARIRKRLVDDFGISPTSVVFGCTHNHQFPPIDMDGEGPMGALDTPDGVKDYARFIEDTVASLIAEGKAALQPARIGIASGDSYINVSRDWPTPAGTLQNANYHGYSDKELTVLKVESENGTLLGLLANYGMHGNMLFGLLMNGEYPLYGGDLPGEISSFVESATGAICGWTIGAAGDQNPIVTSFQFIPEIDETGLYVQKQESLSKESCLLLMKQLARIQGLDIIQLAQQIHTHVDTFDLRHGEKMCSVPGRVAYREQYRAMSMPVGMAPVKTPREQPVVFHFQLVLFNGIGFAGINAEPYARLGRILKDVLPCRHTFVLAMQFNHVGYIPDVRSEEVVGFGTMASPVLDPWDSESAVYESFRDLAMELESVR